MCTRALRRGVRAAAGILSLSILNGCSDGGSTSTSAVLGDRPRGRLSVVPSSFDVQEGDSIKLTPEFTGSGIFNAFDVQWRVLDSSRGVVRNSYFVASEKGETVVEAQFMNLKATAEATVRLAPTAVLAESGSDVPGFAGRALDDSVTVRVTGRDGLPVEEAAVTFHVVEGGGSVSHQTRLTDPSGRARVSWTLGTVAGSNALEVQVEGLDALRIEGEGVADPSTATVHIERGDAQSAEVNTVLPDSLVVRVTDANGNVLADHPVDWNLTSGEALGFGGTWAATRTDGSGHTAIAWRLGVEAGSQFTDVDATGGVQGVAAAPGGNGNGTGGGKGRFEAGAKPGAAVSFDVTPTKAGVRTGRTLKLESLALDAYGNPVDGNVVWSSSDETTASVDAQGNVKGVKDGTVTVQAKHKSMIATASVTVTTPQPSSVRSRSGSGQAGRAGQTLPAALVAEVLADDGLPVPGVQVKWYVQAGGGSVSAASTTADGNGLARVEWTLGGELGTQRVFASIDGVGASQFEATAAAGPARSLEISPGSATVNVGATRELDFVATDAFGNRVEREPTWSSDSTRIATVGSRGTVMGVGPGSTTIRASLDSVSATAQVTVEGTAAAQPNVAKVTVSPANHTFKAPGDTLTLSVVASDSSGTPVSGLTFTYESTNPDVLTVDAKGKVVAISAGAAAVVVGVVGYSATVQMPATVAQPSEGLPSGGFSDSFESGNLSSGGDGFRWTTSVNSVVVEDPAFARTGSHSLRLTHKAKPDGEDNVTQQDFVLPDVKEVWIEYWILVPSNYYHRDSSGPDNNKFFELWDLDRAEEDVGFYVELERHKNADGSSRIRVVTDNDWSIALPMSGYDPNPLIGLGDRGSWIRMRYHVKAGTAGYGLDNQWVGDGAAQIWKNDTVFFDRNDIPLNSTAGGHNFFRNGRLWGWQNSGFDEETVFHVDDVRVYLSDPGW